MLFDSVRTCSILTENVIDSDRPNGQNRSKSFRIDFTTQL